MAVALTVASCSDDAPAATATPTTAAVGAVTTGTSTPAQSSTPTTTLPPIVAVPARWQALERPLHLPEITTTECLTTASAPLGRQHARGDGPIRLQAEGKAYLQMFNSNNAFSALPTIKPYWLWQPGTTADVLLRGEDLGTGSPMLFSSDAPTPAQRNAGRCCSTTRARSPVER